MTAPASSLWDATTPGSSPASLAEIDGDALVGSPCDTSDPAQVKALANALRREEVSILIDDAGIAGPVAPLTEVEPED